MSGHDDHLEGTATAAPSLRAPEGVTTRKPGRMVQDMERLRERAKQLPLRFASPVRDCAPFRTADRRRLAAMCSAKDSL
jgi:hypothetical protein